MLVFTSFTNYHILPSFYITTRSDSIRIEAFLSSTFFHNLCTCHPPFCLRHRLTVDIYSFYAAKNKMKAFIPSDAKTPDKEIFYLGRIIKIPFLGTCLQQNRQKGAKEGVRGRKRG